MKSPLIRTNGGLLYPGAGGLVAPGGGLIREVDDSSIPATLLNLDFTTPTTQAFTTVNATSEWTWQESSGDILDGVGSNDLTTVSSPIYQQTAVGTWDGSSYTGSYAVEFLDDSDWAELSGDTTTFDFDPGSDDLAFRVVFRIGALHTSGWKDLFSKYTSGTGMVVQVSTAGALACQIRDGTTAASFTLAGNHADGAWHYLDFVIDSSTSELRCRTDLASDSADTSALGDCANGAVFRVGKGTGTGGGTPIGYQVRYLAAIEGTDARTLDSESFWTYGNDPTGLIDTHTRASLISDVVANDASGDYVCHFAGGSGYAQMPIVYRSALTNDNSLGLLCSKALTNLEVESEAINGWGNGANVSLTANDGTAPDGFKSADRVTNTGTNGVCRTGTAVSASTTYTFAVWVKTTQGQQIGIGINSNDNLTVLAHIYPTPTAGKWTRYAVTASSAADTTIRPWIIPEVGSSGDDLLAWGAMVVAGDWVASNTTTIPYIRTDGASASTERTLYKLTNTDDRYVKNLAGDVTVVGYDNDQNGASASDKVWFDTGSNPDPGRVLLYQTLAGPADRMLVQVKGGANDYGGYTSAQDFSDEVTLRMRWRDNADLDDLAKGWEYLHSGVSADSDTAVDLTEGAPGDVNIGGAGNSTALNGECVIATVVVKDDAEDA